MFLKIHISALLFQIKGETMLTVGLAFLLISTGLADDAYGGFRLPLYQVPSNYKLDITVDESVINGTKKSFDGVVEIKFQVITSVSTIQLHAAVDIIKTELLQTSVTVINEDFNETTSILTLNLNDTLKVKYDYTLRITYTGNIDGKTMKGFYRSSYVENKVNEYLLATQFEPTYARQAFPCFDEPSFKATFDISITYPNKKKIQALSNANKKSVETVSNDFEKTTFKQTPKMSTYLVAFVVSKLSCSRAKSPDRKVTHSICSRVDSSSTRQWASDNGGTILSALGKFVNIDYQQEKMAQVAIPDFNAGAMENWGLVTYRERLLLFDDKESSSNFKQDILTVIAHEFAHQWFGDYVTCDWWDSIFLNEGFATYFEFFIFSQMKQYELDKQFITLQQQVAFVEDGDITSKAILAKAESPAQISAKFNKINYNKAASIIRMIENIMGSNNFQTALQNYLKSKALSTASPMDLVLTLEKKVPVENLPKEIAFSTVIFKWLNEPGYPVVTVNKKGKDIFIEQKRFLHTKGDDQTTWFVPITYTLESDNDTAKFQTVSPKNWLAGTNNVTITDVFKEENDTSWIILNNQESAFYRVNYDQELWNRIASSLHHNHTKIHVLNRAQIADDSLNLARAGILKYSQAINILAYLVDETDYYPLVSALTGFNYLLTRIGEDSKLGISLKAKLLELLKGAINDVDSENYVDSHINSLKRNFVLLNACKYGHKDCISNAVALFTNWSSIHIDLKNVVYCNGLRYSSNAEEDFNRLWEKYQDTTLSTEQVTIIKALGCTTNVTLLKRYLGYAIEEKSLIRYQDLTAVWNSVLTSNSAGVQAAIEYLSENHKALIAYYPEVSSLLGSIASAISTTEQLNKLKEFLAKNDTEQAYKTAGEQAVSTVNNNLEWVNSIKSDLESYFKEKPTSGATSTVSSVSCLILICISLLKAMLL